MSSRPTIHARDSSGRNISLLNDEPPPKRPVLYRPIIYSTVVGEKDANLRSNSYLSELSTPSIPGLLRSDSYDSQTTNNDSLSPITPGSTHDFSAQSSYLNVSAYPDPAAYEQRDPHGMYGLYPPKRHSTTAERRTSFVEPRPASFEEERIGAERSIIGAKRYPCRYKDTHGCDKTFTTSGHASRHSKIHTAEKAVHCSFPGCHKKFTRADNMKQHLETHYKERSRSSANPTKSYTKSSPSSSIKKTSPARTSPQSSRIELRVSSSEYPPSYSPSGNRYAVPAYSPGNSPKTTYGALDMGNFDKDLPSQSAGKSESGNSCTGLDALVVAAYQVSK